jgi:hypothetical protein
MRAGLRVYDGAVSVIILIAGIAGLGVAAYGLFTLSLDAVRKRQYVDVAAAVAVAVGVVAALVLWGDRFLR